MKLISCTNFVLEQKQKMKESEDGFNIEKYNFIINVCNYANFLKQPLKLGMFVPCDLDANVLEEPKIENDHHGSFFKMQTDYQKEKEYQEAKERVLFDGFELIGENLFTARVANGKESFLVRDIETEMNIDDLVKYNLVLTESAKKQIGL